MASSDIKRQDMWGEEENEGKLMKSKFWGTKYEHGQEDLKWHLPKVHAMLEKHYPTLTNGRTAPLTVLMPLCGKSVDIKWLAEQGHCVVGIEFVELGCRQFFEEQNLPFDCQPLDNILGFIFKCTDPAYNITLLCCDIFKVTLQMTGQIDAIWDRAAFTALPVNMRESYMNCVTSLMSAETVYMLIIVQVDHTVFVGPPHNVSMEQMQTYLGGKFDIQTLEKRDARMDWNMDVEWLVELVISIKKI